ETHAICHPRRFLPNFPERDEPLVLALVFVDRGSLDSREVFCRRPGRLRKRQSGFQAVGTLLGPPDGYSERDSGDRPAASRRQDSRLGLRSWREPSRNCPSKDRKSTRLNSSHLVISYAVFCLKKKK